MDERIRASNISERCNLFMVSYTGNKKVPLTV